MEEQNHFVNDSEMGNPSILSVLIYLLCMFFMIEWRINYKKKKKKKKKKNNNLAYYMES